MNNVNREKLLKEIMAVDFTSVDLQLYLDTHPNDQRSLMIYNNNIQKSKMLRDTYENLYGPLVSFRSCSAYPWRWIESPWPWEG